MTEWKRKVAYFLYIFSVAVPLFFIIRLLWVGGKGFWNGEGVGVYNLIGHFVLAVPSIILWAIAVALHQDWRFTRLFWVVFTFLFVLSFLSNSHF
jgi:hypothetical protein